MERGVYNIRTGISHGTSLLMAICLQCDNIVNKRSNLLWDFPMASLAVACPLIVLCLVFEEIL
jgi:ABC-type cobalamin transport system ATPase subunit